jgi:cobalt-zinc-cadmium efflux system outer membrane protein
MRKGLMSAASVLTVLLSAMAVAAQDRPLTRDELVQLALERNRELLAARERVAEAQGLLRRAGVRPSPTLEVDYGAGRPLGSPGTDELLLRYAQPIELGGKRGKRQTIGVSGVAAAEAEFAARTRQLVFDVKTRAAEVRAAQAKSAALAGVITAGREALRLTRARVGEGDAAALEAQLLAVEVARIEAQHATYRGRATAALADLRRLVGLDATEMPSVGPSSAMQPDLSLALDDLTARALKMRSDLRAARALEQQSTAELEFARAEGVPDVTASVTYTQDSDSTDGLFAVTSSGRPAPIVDKDKRISVGVSIPLFWQGRNRGNTDAAMARATSARLHREYLESAVPRDVEAAYARWTAARDTVSVFRQGVVDQADQNLIVMREAYTLGQLRLLDVLNEQRRLIETRLAHIDAETELAQAAADLERAVGMDLP